MGAEGAFETVADPFHVEILLASADPELAKRMELALTGHSARVCVITTTDALLHAAHQQTLDLVALDSRLPGMESRELLAAIHAGQGKRVSAILLLSDRVKEEWRLWLRNGEICDLAPISLRPDHLAVRIEIALAAHRRHCELDGLRERIAASRLSEPPTTVYTRPALLSVLFRETDRVQRMKTSLCLILFAINTFGPWSANHGAEDCSHLAEQVVRRLQRLLRSYDLTAFTGNGQFVVVLPGCIPAHALGLAERIRQEVCVEPFKVTGDLVRLSACFAVASSRGRSPVVVLQELEDSLNEARREGPETIRMSAAHTSNRGSGGVSFSGC